MPTKIGTAARVLFVSTIYAVLYAVMQILAAMVFGLVGIWKADVGEELSEVFSNSVYSNLFVCTFAAMAAALVLYIAFGFLRERGIGEDLKIKPVGEAVAFPAVILALGCRLGVCVYSAVAENIPALMESLDDLPDYDAAFSTPLKLVFALAITVIIGPVFEEILFRGFIQSELMRGFPPAAAIAVSALIFSISHGLLFQSIFTFFVGLALGWCFYRTGSLFTSIIVHIVFNASSRISVLTEYLGFRELVCLSAAAVVMIAFGCLMIKKAAE